jgi:hypothetical protein
VSQQGISSTELPVQRASAGFIVYRATCEASFGRVHCVQNYLWSEPRQGSLCTELPVSSQGLLCRELSVPRV